MAKDVVKVELTRAEAAWLSSYAGGRLLRSETPLDVRLKWLRIAAAIALAFVVPR